MLEVPGRASDSAAETGRLLGGDRSACGRMFCLHSIRATTWPSTKSNTSVTASTRSPNPSKDVGPPYMVAVARHFRRVAMAAFSSSAAASSGPC